MKTQSKLRNIVGWVLTGLISVMMLASAVAKLAGAEVVVEMFQKWGLRDHLVLIGVLELVSALLFLIPQTQLLGVLLLSAYLGGAIVTHMQHGEPYISPAVLLAFVWLTGYLRHPELLHSLRSAKV